jgi:hypothetical protein
MGIQELKILKVLAEIDNPKRHNYQINYGLWEEIPGDVAILEHFTADINKYDVVLLPMYKRWVGYMGLLDALKSSRAKTVLFDNDSCLRSFDMDFYDGFDFIFYRGADKHGKTPGRSAWLPWSINENLYTPKYGGTGVSFSSRVAKIYPLRRKISRVIPSTKYTGKSYIRHLQQSAAAIHTNSELSPVTRGKVLEFAACGTQVISNRVPDLNWYFPDELIIYFDTVKELQGIVQDFKPDIEMQKQLRAVVEQRHTNKIRAGEALREITKWCS